MARIVVDTGPLVTFFDRKGSHRARVMEQYRQMRAPVFTCEAVLTEAVFLMRRDGLNPKWLLDSIQRGAVQCEFDLSSEIEAIRAMFHRYGDRPISIADASLVRVSELQPESVIFTLDHDFLVYRRNGRQKIPLIAPFA